MDKIHRSQFQLFLIQGVLLIVSLFSLSVHSAKTSQNEAFVVASGATFGGIGAGVLPSGLKS
jgi:hypothetical protein